MANYDFELAKKTIDKLSSLNVLVEASLGMHEDWFWTAETVWSNGEYKVELNSETTIGGIVGSYWATPVLEVELKDGTRKTFNCFEGHPSDDLLSKIQNMNTWVSGCISSDVQDKRSATQLEDINTKEI